MSKEATDFKKTVHLRISFLELGAVVYILLEYFSLKQLLYYITHLELNMSFQVSKKQAVSIV